MSKTAYENLEIYQLAEKLALIFYEEVRMWQALDRDTLGKQLIRSADSIGANIAEGFGRGNGLDQRRMLRIARGSTYETKHWLRLAFTRKLLRVEAVATLRVIIDKLPPKLNAYMKAVSRTRPSTIDNRPSTIEA